MLGKLKIQLKKQPIYELPTYRNLFQEGQRFGIIILKS